VLSPFTLRLFIDRGHDVALGKTKIFIRKPNTLALLDNARTGKIPDLATVVQVWPMLSATGYGCMAAILRSDLADTPD